MSQINLTTFLLTKELLLFYEFAGGLTLAITALLKGFSVTLHEQANQFSEFGAGIQLSPNCVSVLKTLGLEYALEEAGFKPEKAELRLGRSGQRIFSIPFRNEETSLYRHEYYQIHRADLIDLLLNRLKELDNQCLRLASKLEYFSQDSESITAHFEDGTQCKGDLLVGADGIHSVVQRGITSSSPASFTGNVAWRALVPSEAIRDNSISPNATVWCGEKQHAVTYYVRNRKMVNFVGVIEREFWEKESWSIKAEKNELLTAFKDWHPSLVNVIEAADTNNCYCWGLFDRDPLDVWHDRRAVLLGDACHPMLPFLAQGAASSIEDAFCLIKCLKQVKHCNTSNISQAFEAYQNIRSPRTSKLQKRARLQVNRYHKKTKIARVATYLPLWLLNRYMPSLLYGFTNWIYDYNIVEQEIP